ncbi:hypothetical protein [Leuconostoc gasicomitatum]|uniref:hypothetical protein n=1 Tax=Leuconostoc gasicomitatum TaxID=115778 RepID=UPI0015C75D77|nr:hypothetical protein [Leuconostoc gasicomitatum]QLG77599.1 hypothetical protein LeuG3613_01480 [Leuconostoc gasicomitatum]
MDNQIVELLSKSVMENLSQYFESGPEYEIITQQQDLAEFLTGKRRANISKIIDREDFPQIKDKSGKVIGWSWRAIRKWELESSIEEGRI